jgi:hypothetical protein
MSKSKKDDKKTSPSFIPVPYVSWLTQSGFNPSWTALCEKLGQRQEIFRFSILIAFGEGSDLLVLWDPLQEVNKLVSALFAGGKKMDPLDPLGRKMALEAVDDYLSKKGKCYLFTKSPSFISSFFYTTNSNGNIGNLVATGHDTWNTVGSLKETDLKRFKQDPKNYLNKGEALSIMPFLRSFIQKQQFSLENDSAKFNKFMIGEVLKDFFVANGLLDAKIGNIKEQGKTVGMSTDRAQTLVDQSSTHKGGKKGLNKGKRDRDAAGTQKTSGAVKSGKKRAKELEANGILRTEKVKFTDAVDPCSNDPAAPPGEKIGTLRQQASVPLTAEEQEYLKSLGLPVETYAAPHDPSCLSSSSPSSSRALSSLSSEKDVRIPVKVDKPLQTFSEVAKSYRQTLDRSNIVRKSGKGAFSVSQKCKFFDAIGNGEPKDFFYVPNREAVNETVKHIFEDPDARHMMLSQFKDVDGTLKPEYPDDGERFYNELKEYFYRGDISDYREGQEGILNLFKTLITLERNAQNRKFRVCLDIGMGLDWVVKRAFEKHNVEEGFLKFLSDGGVTVDELLDNDINGKRYTLVDIAKDGVTLSEQQKRMLAQQQKQRDEEFTNSLTQIDTSVFDNSDAGHSEMDMSELGSENPIF